MGQSGLHKVQKVQMIYESMIQYPPFFLSKTLLFFHVLFHKNKLVEISLGNK